jgi:SAM-dependent methyltransferase
MNSLTIRDNDGNIVQGRVVLCNVCGMGYVNPRMTKESLDEFYKNDYRTVYPTDSDGSVSKEHAFNTFRYIRGLKGRTILDIGCSYGTFLELAKGAGFKTFGVEPSECALKASKHGNIFTSIEEVKGQYDIITFMNTIEHLIDPVAELVKIRKLLKDDGYLVLSTPNLIGTYFNTTIDGWMSNAHVCHFTPTTLKAICVKAGFDIADARPQNEGMGEKIYCILGKCEPYDLPYMPINTERVMQRLHCADYLVLSRGLLYDKNCGRCLL